MTQQPPAPASLRAKTDQLLEKRREIKKMGGEKLVARQHALGKLTARERIDLLIDPGTFVEIGILAHHQSKHPDLIDKKTPADGAICGWGEIDGRPVCVGAWDFTVLAGAMGKVAQKKFGRLRRWALTNRIPMIWLVDSAGGRVQEAIGATFAETGDLFYEEVMMSGVVPLVCAMMGPGTAGTAYIPGLADFVPMVSNTSFMGLAGPHLVKAAVGEEVDEQTLGGPKVHCEKSGVGDLEVEDDRACIETIKKYLSFFPSHNQEQPPAIPYDGSDEGLLPDGILDIIPANPRQAYNIHKIIKLITDDGDFFEIKPRFARNIVVGFARVGGKPVGIVANQPMIIGGAIDVDAADKAAHFINLCDAFNIPLVFLEDVPGFIVGSAVERQGIIRHGAKMLYAVSEATVPKITFVLRKAYGAGMYVMCSKAFGADLYAAWPSAEISVMGPEGGVNILFRRQIAAAEDPAALRAELVEKYREDIGVTVAAEQVMVDEVIDPRETRRLIIRTLKLTQGKKVDRPWKKHGVVPV